MVRPCEHDWLYYILYGNILYIFIWYTNCRLSQTLKIMMSCGVFVNVPLLMYPVVEIIFPSIQHMFSERYDGVVEVSLRYVLVAIARGFLIHIYFIRLLYARMPNSIRIKMCHDLLPRAYVFQLD